MKILGIVRNSDTPAGRAFDFLALFLIVFSIITLSLETLPGWSPEAQKAFWLLEAAITVLFTMEYGLRVLAEPRKADYVFSFYGILDLIAILPFYLAFLLPVQADLRAVRIFRLFRIFRLLKIARYSRAMARFGNALRESRAEILVFVGAILMLIYLAAAGIYHFEHEAQPEAEDFRSIFHSLWWAVTILTPAAGGVEPVTLGGRLFTFLVLMFGLGVVAVPTGIIAAALSKVMRKEETEKTEQDG